MIKVNSFAIPIYTNVCNFDLKSIVHYLDNEELEDSIKNDEYGSISKNKHILEKTQYSNLKNWIDDQLDFYCKEYLCWDFEKITITQSWISVKNQGQSHQLHRHPNSLVSGIFFWQNNVENIFFKRPSLPNSFEMTITRDNEFSREWICVTPEEGLICLFPSYLEHVVLRNEDISPRFSLPFNSMIFEKIGFENNLTSLDLRKSY
jgi:uncharacterized protein (TIGR02466 family)